MRVFFVVWAIACCTVNCLITDEQEAQQWFDDLADDLEAINNKAVTLAWNYNTNLTDYNSNLMLEYDQVTRTFDLAVAENVSRFDTNAFTSAKLRRAFKQMSNKGISVLPDDEFTELNKIFADMKKIYGSGKICNATSKLSLEPELTNILLKSKDYDEQLWVWKSWRDATGAKMRGKYQRMVELYNKAAQANGRVDAGANWRESYELNGYDFRADLERLYEQMKPFYKRLHLYVRNKLKGLYGADKFPQSGHIPAHIFGNMWAQSWGALYEDVRPYDEAVPIDAGPALEQKTISGLYEMADEFFESLGLIKVSDEFWRYSMLEKPTDGREVVCHASAWNFFNGSDFRIKQCTRKTTESFATIHHEMGHIQYYAQYKDQHPFFRAGANPAFHEAVGDVLGLSVSTPKHLKAVNLINDYTVSNDSDINFLLKTALSKIAFLPFGKLMDDYRWAIFDGTIKPENYNEEWWNRRCKYQGIFPPTKRTEDDFDPGAKYHIAGNVRYVRYFISYVVQFQLHKALCTIAGHTGPLHTCDIYQSQEAGQKLASMLELGSSVEWKDALAQVIDSQDLSAEALVEYFQPLMNWLEQANIDSGEAELGGWTDECPTDAPNEAIPSGECKEENKNIASLPTMFGFPILCLLCLSHLA